MAFSTFLIQSRSLFLAKISQQLHIAVGNKACDLDSIVSAITLSYFMFLTRSDERERKCFLGLIPVPLEEFRLRTEATYLFNKTGIPFTESLVYLDEFQSHLKDNPPETLELSLVDHNLLEDLFPPSFSENVVSIVDHHADLGGKYPHLASKQIEVVGSATTLVAEMYLNHETSSRELGTDAALRNLLLGTILLDTVGLNEKMGKTFEKDKSVVSRLHALDTSVNLKDFFETIQSEKFNSSSLTTADLLIKDYKSFREGGIHYGMSSVLLSISQWLARGEDLPSIFQSLCVRKEIDVLFCLLAYEFEDKTFKRDLVAFNPANSKVDILLLLQKLKEDSSLDLSELTELSNPEKAIWFFHQNVVTSSRKQLEPLVRKIISANKCLLS